MTMQKTKNVFNNYTYAEVNGVLHYGMLQYDPQAKESTFVAYGQYIGIEKVSEDMDGGNKVITIGFDDLQGMTHSIDAERGILGKKKELLTRLLDQGADVAAPHMNVLLLCLRKSELMAEKGRCFHRTGWIFEKKTDSNGKSYTDQRFKSSELIALDEKQNETRYVGPYDLGKKGSFEAWKDIVTKWIIGTIPLEIAVLIGLSPIISSGWGARNLIFHLMGDSGKGKTTCGVASLAVSGCPNPLETATRRDTEGKRMRSLMSSWRGTPNALTAKLDGLDGTLMVFDELSKLEDNRLLAPVIYTVSDGSDKERMESPAAMQTTNVFRTNVLSLGEESLLKKVEAKNSGINVRVCEIRDEFTKSSEQAEAIVQGCYENYGHAAPLFARYIVENLSYEKVAQIREKNLEEYTTALLDAGCPSETPRRLAEFGAVLLTVAEIAEKALGIDFSRAAVKEYLVQQQCNTEQNEDIGLRARAALLDYITTHNANFVTDGSLRWDKSIPCFGRIDLSKDGKSREVSIPTGKFSEIMRQLGFNNAELVIDKLKGHGLVSYEANKRYRKRTITKATGKVPAYVILYP